MPADAPVASSSTSSPLPRVPASSSAVMESPVRLSQSSALASLIASMRASDSDLIGILEAGRKRTVEEDDEPSRIRRLDAADDDDEQ